jgi:hypothetical protein
MGSSEDFMKLFVLVLALATSVLPLKASNGVAKWRAGNPLLERQDAVEIHDEADPTEMQSCYSMGQINLTYESGDMGAPNVGLRITDPRGRKIGYDPLTHRGWQEFPLAQGYLDCDQNEDTSEVRHCTGHIQICGPISGTYKVEVLPARTRNSKYSINLSSTSQQTRDESGLHSTASQTELKSTIRKRTSATLSLQYSRETGTQVKLTKSSQRMARSESSKTRRFGFRNLTATKSRTVSSQ